MRPPALSRTAERGPRRGNSAGFTLLEVLVAFMIAALALGVMFDGVLGGMRAAATASRTSEAVTIARSRLAETQVAVASGIITALSDQEGDDGNGFHWHVQVRPNGSVRLPNPDQPPGGTSSGGPRAVLYSVSVTIDWKADGGHRQVRLDGARLAMRGVPAS